jgi:DNA-binding MarR family transcriptional regulator
LAAQLGRSPAALTNRIDALERRGYVRRQHDRDDRRKVVATLTKAGHEVWQRGIGDIQRVEEELIQQLEPKAQEALERLLRGLILAAEQQPG